MTLVIKPPIGNVNQNRMSTCSQQSTFIEEMIILLSYIQGMLSKCRLW